MREDLTYAIRLFGRQRGIVLLTIAGLALGLGVATAAFSVMNAAVLRGEGIVDSSRAPGILRAAEGSLATAWSYDEFLHLRAGATLLQIEGVLSDISLVRTTAAEADARATALAFVSGGFFSATGGRMMRGRPLDASDEHHVGAPPVVVSYVFWVSQLNRDPAAVGRKIWIGQTPAFVVGVAARGFSAPNSRLLWIPLSAYGAVYNARRTRDTPHTGIEVFGRLPADVALQEAEAQLSGVAATLPHSSPSEAAPLRAKLDPHAGLGRMASADAVAVTVVVFAVIGLVLLLACANAATVLIAGAITREREMGVRAALGASRWRITRQLLTESVALGTIAATIGLLLARWAMPAIGALIDAPAGSDLTPDLDSYLFLGIVTLLSSVGAGLAPAWHGRGADLLMALKGEGAHAARVAPRRLRSTLVMTQTAASLLLIVMSALFVRATARAASIDVGFEADGLYSVAPRLQPVIGVQGAQAASQSAVSGQGIDWGLAISELRAIPGVTAVTVVELPPFGDGSRTSITRNGPSEIVIRFNRTDAEYFATVGLRMLTGRTFTSSEVRSAAPVAVVSQSLARAYFPGESPLGQLLPAEIKIPTLAASPPRPVIVGVVTDAITTRLHERSLFAVYEPLDPVSEQSGHLLMRVAPGTPGAIQEASQRLRAFDPQGEVRITSVATRLQQEVNQPRMLAALTAIVGTIAIVLCVIGLYGLTAAVVRQRLREMGIRVALGANSRDLLRLLMRDSLTPVAAGLVVGAGMALLAGRLIAAAMFFGVPPHDPWAFAAASASVLTAAIAAVTAPTRRAARVNPASVLRQT